MPTPDETHSDYETCDAEVIGGGCLWSGSYAVRADRMITLWLSFELRHTEMNVSSPFDREALGIR